MIPEDAVEAARRAFDEKLAWCDRHSIDPRREEGLALRAALEAAAPHLAAQTLEEVAAELDGADRVTRERDGYTATISLPNAATYLRGHAATLRTAK